MEEATTDSQGSATRRLARRAASGSGACRLLVFGSVGVLLYFAHFAFIPPALALLFALVLSAPVEALYKRGVPRGLSSFIILAIALGIIGCGIGLLWKPVQYWYNDAPHTIHTVKQKFAPLARMTAAFVDHLNAARVLTIMEAVRAELGRFYAVTALINVGLGIVTAVAMMLWGMPTPYVWGALAALLNFIPYAGPSTTLVILTLVAAMSFDQVPRILGVAGTFLAIAGIEGQVVQPLFVGRRLQINPLLIFLGLWLGGLYWGIAGVLLATPVLVALKVVAANARGGRAILEFLGPNGASGVGDVLPDDDGARRPPPGLDLTSMCTASGSRFNKGVGQ